MLAHTAKLSRAESARINGAKSNGPKTSAGLLRSQTANFKDGLYAVRDYNLPGESNEEFAEFQVRIHGYWQPNGFLAGQLVEELAGNIWEANRVQASKSGYLHGLLAVIARNSPPCVGQAKLNLEAEKQASVAGGTMDRSNARLGRLARDRDRIERQLLRLEKRSCTSGWSQKSLKTKNRQNAEIPASEDAKPGDGAVSESGLLYLPIIGGVAKAAVKIGNLGQGRLTFSIPNITAALVMQQTSGVVPSTINFTMEPGRSGVIRQPGTNLFTNAGGGAGHDGHEGVPVIGGGDDDGLEVFVVEQFPEVRVGLGAISGGAAPGLLDAS